MPRFVFQSLVGSWGSICQVYIILHAPFEIMIKCQWVIMYTSYSNIVRAHTHTRTHTHTYMVQRSNSPPGHGHGSAIVLSPPPLEYRTLQYTAMQYTRIHYTNYTTPQLQLQLQLQLHHAYYTLRLQLHYTTLQLQLHYATLHPAVVGEVTTTTIHCNHSKKHNFNHLSVHQWIRSAISDSQQPTSPIGLLFLKLPPPPCAVLLVCVYIYNIYNV